MDGFDRKTGVAERPEIECPNANPPYSYVPRYETKPYFFIGKHYVFADEMFPSNFDSSSFISHQYIIAAASQFGGQLSCRSVGLRRRRNDSNRDCAKDDRTEHSAVFQ